jgi:hypothetical protein
MHAMNDVHADMSLEFERRLLPIAERARHGDQDARDALFTTFQPKLRRFYRRVQFPRRVPGQAGSCTTNMISSKSYSRNLLRRPSPAAAIPLGRHR